ncbi:hypothetical protein ACFL2Z_01085 [Candidatus Eisenbacteria bacterium]|uniref:Uncharacterized protein n=1 Tax=Eiseniibacteriota bacterium TaxID=2212470 RepID=A0ABV6YN51_UNCEI
MRYMRAVSITIFTLSFVMYASQVAGAEKRLGDFEIQADDVPCCGHAFIQALVWSGTDPLMTLEDLAAYCTPVLWFSPDEPLLGEAEGKDIMLPEPFPFEGAPGGPVTYYMVQYAGHEHEDRLLGGVRAG